jgi:hypothetical protein
MSASEGIPNQEAYDCKPNQEFCAQNFALAAEIVIDDNLASKTAAAAILDRFLQAGAGFEMSSTKAPDGHRTAQLACGICSRQIHIEPITNNL